MTGREPIATGPGASSSAAPPGSAPTIGVPRGGGAIRGIGEKFGTNPVTGTASMTVPIATSPGRSGFGPQLVLGYDSGSGNGPFGFGWSIDLPAITRKTDKGLPRYDDDGESDVYVLSAAEDLVPVGGTQHSDPGAPGHAVRRYRPRIEGLFARIERWTHQGSGEVHWRSISRDNITTTYGTSANSRIADPADPRRVFSWLISASYDSRGNAATYDYAEEDGHNVDLGLPSERTRSRSANRYPRVIRYGNDRPNRDPLTWEPTDPRDGMRWHFEVVFDYDDGRFQDVPLDPRRGPDEQHRYVRLRQAGEDLDWAARPDPFSGYRAGFEVRTHRRCRRVLMFHRFDELGDEPCLVRSTDFDYADLDYSFLRSVTHAGYVQAGDGSYLRRELPPVGFEYSRAVIDPTVRELDRESLRNLPAGVDGTAYEWVDLDGEGATGVLTRQAGAAFSKPSLGEGRFGPLRPLATQPSAGVGTLLDLAGDGRLDAVVLDGRAPGFHERTDDGGWTGFTPFRELPALPWADPAVRFVDLTGDGLADVLVDGDSGLRWYPSLGEGGFAAASRTCPPWDAGGGPRLLLADREQSVYLADMTGDGLADVARVRNGEVCYWPNLGYGRFGAKVTMDGAPWFDHPERFEQQRLRLADVDGTGTTDLVYLGAAGPAIYANRSGNSWDEPVVLHRFPRMDQPASVTIADLLGNGTACLVWASPLPGDAQRPVRYVDLMGGQKPHLLVRTVNNHGAETTVGYTTSTRSYLADRGAGRPWPSRVPFPVHVVERTETHDRVSGSRLVTRCAYHDGYFDGVEREFRGFGLVEKWDTEVFGETGRAEASNLDPAFEVPPVLTRTWFHTGRPRADLAATIPPGLTAEEEREAHRALKGSMLRQEVYALDGTPLQDNPYTVTEQHDAVRLLQHRGGNRHAVFFKHGVESVSRHFERRAADPRVRHELTLDVDDYGNVLRYAGIGYGRQAPDPRLEPRDQAVQAQDLVTYTENDVTNAVDGPGGYRTPQASESRTYELTGVPREAGALLTAAEVRAAITTAGTRGHRQPATAGRIERRLVERLRTRYRRDDLAGPLPPGALQPLALPFESYRLAFPDGLVDEVYQGRVTAAMLREDGAYQHEDGAWWVPSGQVFYAPDPAAEELAQARAHFFLPRRYRGPFGAESVVGYDHDLLVRETVDAMGNRTTAEQDWRVLQPAVVTDANRNRSAVAFDALGLVVGSALMGPAGLDPTPGDRLTGAFRADLTQADVEAYFADPRGPLAAELLGDATARMVHDLRGQPLAVATVARETHVADLAPGQRSRLQVSVAYADGLGREIQKKAQAEHGRWVGTGWTVFNNKGKPVRRFEPFFSDTHGFEPDTRAGVSAIVCYDPLERVVATLHPNHTWEKVDLDPWGQQTWDVSDTVLVADPRTDPTAGGYFSRLPEHEFLPTWYARRAGGGLGGRERAAAAKAARHAGTPSRVYCDPLGRAFLTVADDGARQLATRMTLDVEGNQQEVVDPADRTVIRYDYSVVGGCIHQASMEAGQRWTLGDAGGNPIYSWDERGHRLRTVYDQLRRPVEVHLREGDHPEVMVGRSVYGESRPDAEAGNLRTRLARVYDQAGIASYQEYDFKGNLVRSGRQLAQTYDSTLDWSRHVSLGAAYAGANRFDALNRAVELTEPDGTVVRPTYNDAGLLERLDAQLRGGPGQTSLVTGIDYDAKGQRTEIRYGNGVRTGYHHDPETFRLVRVLTRREGDRGRPRRLQDLSYTYDPMGNVTTLRDRSRQAVFFRGRRVDADRDYTYDALYRLVEATGREHLGQGGPAPSDDADGWAATRLHAQDGQALARYRERYAYDPAGNVTAVRHRGADPAHPGWTRTFHYDEPSQLDPAQRGNRLTGATAGGHTDVFSRDGDGYDPHGAMLRLPHLSHIGWDYRGQLRSTARQVDHTATGERTWYVYDAAGKRVRKVTVRSDGRMRDDRVYFGAFEEHHRHGANPVSRQTLHVMDDNRRVALVETRTAGHDPGPRQLVRFQLADNLGSVSLEVDDRARVITYEEYAPYGSTTVQAVRRGLETPKRYRYTGMERDDETGFSYHGARYYAPWLCRWTTCDPAGLADGLNLYAYVSGRPTMANDPTGRQGGDPQEQMMGMMWDRLGWEISAMIEGVFGGSAYVNVRTNRVDYSGPTGGVGGMVGGVVRAATLRLVPIEDHASPSSLVGMELGAGVVIVLDPGARMVTGTTVTGQDTSRAWAALQFGLDVLPIGLELHAVAMESRALSVESRMLTVETRVGAADAELLDLTHIGANNTGHRSPTVTNPTCRGDLCVADVGAYEANLRNPGQTPITNTEFVAASGREVSQVEAPIADTGEAISFLNKGYTGLHGSGRISQPITASIPMEPTLQPGNYLAIVDGPMGEHALHATVTDEMIGRRFISEGRLVTETEALEIVDDGGRVVDQPVYRTEYYDPQNGVCVEPTSRPRSFIRLGE